MQNFYIKKKKTKNKTATVIANQYLNNICLNDKFNENLFSENISNKRNKYKIFLYLNTIKSNKNEQNDLFNRYKEKLITQNHHKPNELYNLLKNDFQNDEHDELEENSLSQNINILQHQESTNSANSNEITSTKVIKSCLKSSPRLSDETRRLNNISNKNSYDIELEYLENMAKKSELDVSLISRDKYSLSSSSFKQNKQQLNNSQANDTTTTNPRLNLQVTTFQRTISESSSESAWYNTYHGVRSRMLNKRQSQNLLEKLTSEK